MSRERVHLNDDEAERNVRLLETLGSIAERSGDHNLKGEARTLARDVRDRLANIIKLHGEHPHPMSHGIKFQPTQAPIIKPTADGVTEFIVPAGIGDIAWMAPTLQALAARWKAPIRLKVAGDQPRRAQEFVELLTGIQFAGYAEGVSSQDVLDAVRLRPNPPGFDALKGQSAFLSANNHIEHGERIEDWYPDENREHDELALATTDAHRARAKEILGDKPAKLIGIYPGSYDVVRRTGFWAEDAWLTVAKGIHADRPGVMFVLFGAKFDTDLVNELTSRLKGANIPVIVCLGEPFGAAVEVIKSLDLLLAYPSGLPVVATLIGVPVVWWLPQDVPDESGGGNVRNVTGWIPLPAIEDGLIETRAYEAPAKGLAGILASKPYQLSAPPKATV